MIIVCCVVVNNRALFLAWQGGYIKPSANAVIYTDMDFNYLIWVKWFLKFVLHVMIRCMYLQPVIWRNISTYVSKKNLLYYNFYTY